MHSKFSNDYAWSPYVVAGRPPQALTAYGSFEPWSRLIRAALVWCGQPDPCLGRVGLEASSDDA